MSVIIPTSPIHFRPVTALLTGLLFIVLSINIEVLSVSLRAVDSVRKPPFHPILKFTTTKELDVNHLDLTVYKQLNGISESVHWETYHSDEIEMGEVTVVKHLCELVKGLTKSEVERLAGAPDIRVQQIQCWSNSMPGEENWLYHFGYSHVNVQIVFRHNRCTRAELFDAEKLIDIENWWSDQIERFAIGKTELDVIAFAGEPSQKQRHNYDPSSNSWFNDEIFLYPIGYHTCLDVSFKDGKCIGVETGTVFH